jgi:uncharacterized membrane protein YiaA
MKVLELLKSRKFIALVLAIIVLVVQVWIPEFKLDEMGTAALAVVVIGYILAVALDPGQEKAKLKELVCSRKFWASLIALGIVICDGFNLWVRFGISKDQVFSVVSIITTFAFGTGLKDFLFLNKPEPDASSPLIGEMKF